MMTMRFYKLDHRVKIEHLNPPLSRSNLGSRAIAGKGHASIAVTHSGDRVTVVKMVNVSLAYTSKSDNTRR